MFSFIYLLFDTILKGNFFLMKRNFFRNDVAYNPFLLVQ